MLRLPRAEMASRHLLMMIIDETIRTIYVQTGPTAVGNTKEGWSRIS
jgi:hypothetical protein